MKNWRNVARMYSARMHLPVKDLLSANKQLDEDLYASLINAGNELKGLNIYFRDIPVNVDDWELMLYQFAAKFPNKTLVNIFDHTRLPLSNHEKTEEERITKLMLAGVRAKNRIECINFFLSQLNRKIEDGERSDIGTTGILASYLFGADYL